VSNAQVTSLFTARETMSRTLNNIASSTDRLDKTFGRLRGRMRAAVEFNIVNRGMDLFWRGVNRAVDALPDLIHRGEQWAATVDAISDATGLSAQQASELAAVQQRVGGSTDALTRGFVALAKSVYTNRDAWKEMGVRVALNRDGSVDAYRTFQNLRQAIQATGGSLLSTAAAQTALGRGGKDMLDLLQLTDRQYRLLADDARASGQVMSGAAAAAAESWDRAQQRVGSVLDGLGTQLLGGLAPVLTRFADGFSDWIQRNMASIVRLVVGAANTVLTVVGDLLGMDLGQWSFTEQVAAATPRVRDLAGGVRDLSKAHDKAARSTSDHGKEHRRLMEELARAQRQLAQEQNRTTLLSRMSAYDAERWRQEKLRRVQDAQDRVAEARKALADHKATLDQMTANARAAGIRMSASMNRPFRVKKGRGGAVADVFGGIEQVVTDSTATGHAIASAIKDAIFGPGKQQWVAGGLVVETRSGGLITQLQNVGTFLGTVGGHLTTLNGLLSGPAGLIAAMLGLSKVLPGMPVPGIPTGKSNNFGWQMWGGFGAGVLAQEVLGQQDRRSGFSFDLFKQLNDMLGRDYGADLNRSDAKHPGKGTLEYLLDFESTLKWWSDFLKPPAAINSADYFYNEITGQYEPKRTPYSGWRTDGPDNTWGEQGPKLTPQWVKDHPLLGFGFDTSQAGVQAIAEAMDRTNMGRALGTSGEVPLALGDIASGIFSLRSLIDERLPSGGSGGTGGTGNLADRVGLLESRMDTVSRRNGEQDKRMDGLRNVNVQQGQAITDVRGIAKVGQSFRNDWKNKLPQYGRSIDDHERRLDKLDGGGGSNPDRQGFAHEGRRTRQNTDEMVHLLRQIRNQLRDRPVARAATSSLRP